MATELLEPPEVVPPVDALLDDELLEYALLFAELLDDANEVALLAADELPSSSPLQALSASVRKHGQHQARSFFPINILASPLAGLIHPQR